MTQQSIGELAIDVYQTKDNFVVEAPVAGVEMSDLSVEIENDLLIIKGERAKTEEKETRDYFKKECYWGSFSAKVSLPNDVDKSKIKAFLKKGILKVVIPRIKKQEEEKKKIEIYPLK